MIMMGVETLLKMLLDACKWCAFDFELISNSFKHFGFVSPLRTVLVFLWLYIFMPSGLSSVLLKYPGIYLFTLRLCDKSNTRGLNVRFLKAMGISVSLVNILFWRLMLLEDSTCVDRQR